jgi:tRNA(fMet)-specific endonuclease VapC
MLVLDTDHLTALERPGVRGEQLLSRLDISDQKPATTIINIEEIIRGFLAQIHKYNTEASRQAPYYARLHRVLAYYSEWNILPFDATAVAKYEELRLLGLRRIGARDLRIAAIVLSQGATLLSANLTHFREVPGLLVEDWLYSS